MRDVNCENSKVMTRSRIVLFLLVAIYTMALMMIEWQTSQDFVRQFVTDIGQNKRRRL